MLKELVQEKTSKLVQIMNEVDDLKEEEKSYVLYWLRAKKNPQAAASDLTIRANDITLDDIYAERNALRKTEKQ